MTEQTGRPDKPAQPWARPETTEQRYLRQTRNAAVFLAIVVAVGLVIGVFVTSNQLSHLNCVMTQGSAYSSC